MKRSSENCWGFGRHFIISTAVVTTFRGFDLFDRHRIKKVILEFSDLSTDIISHSLFFLFNWQLLLCWGEMLLDVQPYIVWGLPHSLSSVLNIIIWGLHFREHRYNFFRRDTINFLQSTCRVESYSYCTGC